MTLLDRLFRPARHQPARTVSPIADLEAQISDAAVRRATAMRAVDAALLAQHDLDPDDRNDEVVNLCLDVWNALSGRQVRRPVPVVPGPSS